MKKKLLLLVMLLMPMMANAYDACVDGIYYYFDTENKTAEVTFSSYGGNNQYAYSGTVKIPSTVVYNGREYDVTSIGEAAFMGCSGLTSVTIPNSVTTIGRDAFSETGWYNNQPDGILYLCSWLIGYKGEKPIGKLIILEGTNGIANAAFYECSDLTSVNIPDGVTSIGSSAFSLCSGLASVTIPNSVTSIGWGAFSDCSSLTSVTTPNSVTSFGDYVFYNCSSLTSIIIPYGVKSIGDYAFFCCSSLTSVTIPNCVTTIGECAFGYCGSLTSVTIPNSVTRIGNSAFYDCGGLTSVTIPNSVTSIGNSAFSECGSLTSVTIPNCVTSIDNYVFYNCSSLTSVTIPNSVTSIGNSAFYWCCGLTSVTIPNSVTRIGSDAFYGCSNIKTLNISDLAAWCRIAFGSASSHPLYGTGGKILLNGMELKDIVIPEDVTSINNYTFYRCTNITSVTIPNCVTTIGECAFEQCSGLVSVKLPDNLQIIKRQSFSDCISLKGITIPSSVEYIYQGAFAYCNALECVKALPETPPFLYASSFSNYNIPLYAPENAIATYQTTSPWSNFTSFLTLSGDEPETPRCAKPTITYKNGEITFGCDTEGVTYHYALTTPTASEADGNNIKVSTTYTVTVYAKKEGYLNSEIATQEIDVCGLKGDVNQDGKVTISDAVGVVNIILNEE